MPIPIIAIVGRPNVGKSRLFNRLVGSHQAIVEDTPGVTRDRNYGRSNWHRREVEVIDTGGFEPEIENQIVEQMREQALLAVEEADVIIFVVDGRVGRTADDDRVSAILRQSAKPIFLAVNKLDTYSLAVEVADFYALGIPHVFACSAEHGLGVDELMDAVELELPEYEEEEEDENAPIQIAVIGKPNSGKSTLINQLLGDNRLLTSDIAGTTRDAIDTLVTRDDQRYILIDTAGIRRKRSISIRLEKYSVMRAIRTVERASVVLLLIDATEGVTDQDAKIAHLAHDRGKAIALILNKWDLIDDKKTNTVRDFKQKLYDKLSFCKYAPIMTISALSGQRTHKLLDMVDHIHQAASVRISTGALNRTFGDIVRRNPPPIVKNLRPRFYYITQVAVHPPSFVIQSNHPRVVRTAYRRYLTNKLRETYPFEGSPIRLFIRRVKGRHEWGEER